MGNAGSCSDDCHSSIVSQEVIVIAGSFSIDTVKPGLVLEHAEHDVRLYCTLDRWFGVEASGDDRCNGANRPAAPEDARTTRELEALSLILVDY
jgi:hypothetical protein